MERETGVYINLSKEKNKSGIKLTYVYKDMFGSRLGSFESEELFSLSEPSSKEAAYFDGSIETPYGNFMLECKISEAKKALVVIADFIKVKVDLADLEKHLERARIKLNDAQNKFRGGGEADYEASNLVNNLQQQKRQLEFSLKSHEDALKDYRV